MTGWGQDGPMAQMAGHDINYLGLTGFLHAIGRADDVPTPPLNIGADYAGGTMFLLFGIMAALWERQTSGRGQVIDAAMVDGASALMALVHSMIAMGRWSEARESNLLDGGAPHYRTYACADGKFLALGPLEPQFFAEMIARAGIDDAQRADQTDPARWPERREDYAAIFRQKTRDEWTAIFDGTDACATPVLTWSEAADHPHLAARQTFVVRDGVTQAAPAPRFSRTPADAPRPPPAAGQDTEAALRAAGYDEDTIARLRAEGVLT
jgi:alpha-methylacyl-CoA racemase